MKDARQDHLVHIYTIIHVIGMLAGFVAPLAYSFVQCEGVVLTM